MPSTAAFTRIPFKQTPQAQLFMEVFRPMGSAQCAVVFFVCGGWNGFDLTKFYAQATYFAERGALCAIAEVRTMANHGTSPRECLIDAKSALRFVRGQAKAWDFPAQSVVAVGGSAAGHIVLACASVPGWEEPGEDSTISAIPDLVCAFNPAVLPPIALCASPAERLQQRLEKFGGEKAMLAVSPMAHIRPGLPPVLILIGTDDPVTPLSEAAWYHLATITAGNQCRLVTYPGGLHGFFNYRADGNPFFTQTVDELDRFLVAQGRLTGSGHSERFSYAGSSQATVPGGD